MARKASFAFMVSGAVAVVVHNGRDKCECLNWKEAYANKIARCGAGPEFYFIHHQKKLDDPMGTAVKLAPMVGEEFCTRFFETLDNNYCVNINMGNDEGQFCYVDPGCEDLKGGINSPVRGVGAWKQCGPDDKLTRSFTPPQLAQLATDAKLDLGLLHKMSYPLSDHMYKEVSFYFGPDASPMSIKSIPKELEQQVRNVKDLQDFLVGRFGDYSMNKAQAPPPLVEEMDKVVTSETPTSFDMDGDHHPPHIIVHKEKVYLVLGGLICLKGC